MKKNTGYPIYATGQEAGIRRMGRYNLHAGRGSSLKKLDRVRRIIQGKRPESWGKPENRGPKFYAWCRMKGFIQ